MGVKTTKTTRKTAPAAKVRPAVRKPKARRQTTVVREIRKRVEDKLTQDVEKASLGDYIRLVQLEKELKEDATKEMTVTWVESSEK